MKFLVIFDNSEPRIYSASSWTTLISYLAVECNGDTGEVRSVSKLPEL